MDDDAFMILEREAGKPEHTPQLAVGFCLHPVEDEHKSAEAGRPIFVDREFVRIIVPGDRNSLVFQPATEEHKRRFPRAYAAFKERSTIAREGTPIEQWPPITRAMALTLKAAHIHTVEMLAEVSDTNLSQLGYGIRELREKARAYVQQAKDSALAQKLSVENGTLREQLQMQQDQIKRLSDRIAELTERLDASAPKPAKGRQHAVTQ